MQTPPVEAFDKEALVKRNPHENFIEVEASRPDCDASKSWIATKTPNPSWKPDDGASRNVWEKSQLIAIDPQATSRTVNQNYKLMISTTVPRPIALVSTVAADGTQNLAPFSYFNNVTNDPPLYSLSFHGEEANDSLRNLLDTGECCISTISDWFLEAANFTSVNTPPQISEWPLSGLHPLKSSKVQAPHVAESAFSIECKLHTTVPIFSKAVVKDDGSPVRTATHVLVEAVMFHVRGDAVDEAKETVDIKVLRPVWRGGGITYGSCFSGWETPRPDSFRILRETQAVKDILGGLGNA
jgi:flavin reductase (DIM6/NTAB) family NADH-FMN oxidoreductase RutF